MSRTNPYSVSVGRYSAPPGHVAGLGADFAVHPEQVVINLPCSDVGLVVTRSQRLRHKFVLHILQLLLHVIRGLQGFVVNLTLVVFVVFVVLIAAQHLFHDRQLLRIHSIRFTMSETLSTSPLTCNCNFTDASMSLSVPGLRGFIKMTTGSLNVCPSMLSRASYLPGATSGVGTRSIPQWITGRESIPTKRPSCQMWGSSSGTVRRVTIRGGS